MASVSEEAEKNGELTRAQGKEFTAGKFFCITEDVWSVGVKKSKPEHWDAFWREGGNVSIQLRQDDPNSDPYTITRNALNAGVTAAPPKSTRSESIGSSLTRKKEIWPVDIVGVPAGRFSEIANLLPAGHVVHEEWFGVAAAVLGLPKTASVLEQLMACRGVRKEYPNDDVDASNKDNNNGTISDLATGLMWEANDSKKGMNWEDALAYATKKNKEKYLGHSDWRLPNTKELQSIVDYSRSPQITHSAAIDPLFK